KLGCNQEPSRNLGGPKGRIDEPSSFRRRETPPPFEKKPSQRLPDPAPLSSRPAQAGGRRPRGTIARVLQWRRACAIFHEPRARPPRTGRFAAGRVGQSLSDEASAMNQWQGWLYLAAVLIPLGAFLIEFLAGRWLGRLNAWIATIAIGSS